MKIFELNATPSAKRVNIFLAEKGIEIERVNVDIRAGENLSHNFKAKSINGQIPVLELDDGTTICESIAICRYFDALHPNANSLFGDTPTQKAQIEMWQRVVELQGLFVAFQAFRNITGIFSDRENCIKEWGQESRQRLIAFLPKLEQQLSTEPYIAGQLYSIADITTYVLLDFIENLDIYIDETTPNLQAWRQRLSQRTAIKNL
ncbi:glutathione S-transferase [Photobacterium damselae]|uniref:glutathione S-transferase n=1 Tax=Photobacterium damselae TaxID=38293 RepID=UPI00083A1522|nr:glutathione S-transferase [Photobacterium damselae]NVO74412.1 glutathione S-transferase [Photobacterium damselae subsp. damselae]QSH58752.1 glutathione S-transferase [Photobacterium damselae subsp. damselae]SPY29554.1 Glutathione S-transferase GST-6.0 [Photobacterium damselae]